MWCQLLEVSTGGHTYSSILTSCTAVALFPRASQIGHLHLHDPERLLQLTEALMDPSTPQHRVGQLQDPGATSNGSDGSETV